MKVCKYCEKEIQGNHGTYANHVRWCEKNTTNGDKGRKKLSEVGIERYKIISPISNYEVFCNSCNNKFILYERESKFKRRKGRYFCSYSCARKRNEETKKKISKSSKDLWKNADYANRVISNNTNQNRRFSSLGEEEIKKYLKENFTDDGWTSGGGFKYKEVILTRDMYSNKLKTIVEYDGIWHFKDIYGQLQEKQYKDSILEEWCLQNNWKLIRIKDDLYTKDKVKYLQILLNSIYNENKQIIKIY